MDLIFVWVGVNDILAKLSWNFPFWRIVMNQPWAQNHDIFKQHYHQILRYVVPKAEKVITVSPLFIGEEYQNKWNREIQELFTIIQLLSKQYETVEPLDIQQIFIRKLKQRKISSYLPKNIVQGWTDAATLRSIKKIDEKAAERGLHFTFDGVHLNSAGAQLAAETFLQVINGKKK